MLRCVGFFKLQGSFRESLNPLALAQEKRARTRLYALPRKLAWQLLPLAAHTHNGVRRKIGLRMALLTKETCAMHEALPMQSCWLANKVLYTALSGAMQRQFCMSACVQVQS